MCPIPMKLSVMSILGLAITLSGMLVIANAITHNGLLSLITQVLTLLSVFFLHN